MLNIVLAVLVGILIGWISAHTAIARECEMLGGFYVGDRVYACEPAGPRVTPRDTVPH
jgi:hypothetical protein